MGERGWEGLRDAKKGVLFEGTFISFFKDKMSKRSHKTVGIKVFITIFAWWWKDPDPYFWQVDPDGPKHVDPVDLEHWLYCSSTDGLNNLLHCGALGQDAQLVGKRVCRRRRRGSDYRFHRRGQRSGGRCCLHRFLSPAVSCSHSTKKVQGRNLFFYVVDPYLFLKMDRIRKEALTYFTGLPDKCTAKS